MGKAAKSTDHTLSSYLEGDFKPLARDEQRNTRYPLDGFLKSGRIAEHRSAAELLGSINSQQGRTDMIVRALVLYRALQELGAANPDCLKRTLDELVGDEQ